MSNRLMAVVIGVIALSLWGWGWSRTGPTKSVPNPEDHTPAAHSARPPLASSLPKQFRVRALKLKAKAASNMSEPAVTETGVAELPPGGLFANLQTRPAWTGPLPRTVDELPDTAEVARRVEEYGGREAVQTKMDILNELRKCAEAGPPARSGTVGFQVEIHIDPRSGTMQGRDLVLLASLMDEKDDLHVLHCLTTVYGKTRPISGERIKSLELPEGQNWYGLRHETGFPIETDGFYPWIMAK